MTKEEILAMEAGEELDELVARQIMEQVPCDGWKPISFGMAGGMALQKTCSHEDGKCYPTQVISQLGGIVGGCPQYSSEIKVAWKVVEKVCNWNNGDAMLTLKGQGKNPTPLEDDDTGEWWEATIGDNSGREWQVEGKTAPEAICKAALMAKLK